METKHTKGEWSCQLNAVLKDGSYAIKSGNTMIGFASDSDTDTTEETQANAKLMATAPVMLNAIAEVLEMTEADQDVFARERKILFAAIKKATE